MESESLGPAKPEKLSLVKVVTPSEARKDELIGLGLDLTEHGGDGFVDVVLHGADDAESFATPSSRSSPRWATWLRPARETVPVTVRLRARSGGPTCRADGTNTGACPSTART